MVHTAERSATSAESAPRNASPPGSGFPLRPRNSAACSGLSCRRVFRPWPGPCGRRCHLLPSGRRCSADRGGVGVRVVALQNANGTSAALDAGVANALGASPRLVAGRRHAYETIDNSYDVRRVAARWKSRQRPGGSESWPKPRQEDSSAAGAAAAGGRTAPARLGLQNGARRSGAYRAPGRGRAAATEAHRSIHPQPAVHGELAATAGSPSEPARPPARPVLHGADDLPLSGRVDRPRDQPAMAPT